MKLYYWKDVSNFGDLLGSLLLKRFSKLDSEWSSAHQADLVIVGSILEQVPKSFKGIIAGCGKLHRNTELEFNSAHVLGVRGPLTAKGFRGNICIGDPGLLADEIVGNQDKIYDLGIVPHWTDRQLETNPTFLKYNPKIIRVTDNPIDVIKQIGQCKKIVSSSLHGIILADAFGIPRRTELAPRMISHPQHEGGTFKWEDYAASLDMEFVTGVTQEPDRNIVIERQHQLFDMFEELKRIFK